jgi:ABC-2 type transport system ATP-binding protein
VTKAAPRLAVKGLRHLYAERPVIEDLTFTLRAGRAIALVGPNGAGKTTVLKCIVGSAEPAAGEILLDGQPIDERAEMVRRHVASLLDDLDFFPDLTVAEHLDLLARAHGNAEPEDLVDTVLHDVGMLGAAEQLPGSLSSGQRRRLALATALVRPRKLLVLDEPEARLDSAGVTWLAEMLIAEKKTGTSILFASHDAALVDAVADETVTLTPLS